MNATTLGRMEAEIKNIQTTLTAIQQTTQAVLNAINYTNIPDKDATNSLERIEADVRDIQAHVR
jgi:predicted  nucleic acid-binding Zn-ribbon protein